MHVTPFSCFQANMIVRPVAFQLVGSRCSRRRALLCFCFSESRVELQRGKPGTGECDRANLVRNLAPKENVQSVMKVVHTSCSKDNCFCNNKHYI